MGKTHDQDEPVGTLKTTRGVAKWWRPDKGYGAIATDETAPWDIWCHFSSIEADGYRELIAGEPVDVDYLRLDKDSFRYVAHRVRRDGGPTGT